MFKHSFTNLMDRNENMNELAQNAIKTTKNPVKLTFEDVKFEVTITLNKHDAKA